MALNPHQKNKVDISSLSADEQRLFRLYGKLPNKKDLLQNKLKERKYFDSGDYALSKAGKASDVGVTQIGREHPVPEKIPHLSTSPSNGAAGILGVGANGTFPPPNGLNGMSGQSGSPVKESSYLSREQSIDDQPGEEGEEGDAANTASIKTTSTRQSDVPKKVQQDSAVGASKVGPAAAGGAREGVPIRGTRP